MSGMTYEEAAAQADVEGFRYIGRQADGCYAIVMTCLMWVSSAILVEVRTCKTTGQAQAIAGGNTRLLHDLSSSRHTIRRHGALDGRERVRTDRAHFARAAQTNPDILVPGITTHPA